MPNITPGEGSHRRFHQGPVTRWLVKERSYAKIDSRIEMFFRPVQQKALGSCLNISDMLGFGSGAHLITRAIHGRNTNQALREK